MPSKRRKREKRIMRKVLGRSNVLPFNLLSLLNRGGAHHSTPIINRVKSSVLKSQYVAKALKRNDPSILPFQQGGGMAPSQDTDGAGIFAYATASNEQAWTGVDPQSLPHFVADVSFPFNGQASPIQRTTPLTWPLGATRASGTSDITLTSAPETLGIGGSQVMIYSQNGPKIPFVPVYDVGGGYYHTPLSENGVSAKKIARVYFHGSMFPQSATGDTTPGANTNLGNFIHLSGAGNVQGYNFDNGAVFNIAYWPTQSVAQVAIAECDLGGSAGYAALVAGGTVLKLTGASGATYVLSSSLTHPGANVVTAAGTDADPFIFSTGSNVGECFLNLKTVIESAASKDFIVRTLGNAAATDWSLWAVLNNATMTAMVLYSRDLGTNNNASITSSNSASLNVWAPQHNGDNVAVARSQGPSVIVGPAPYPAEAAFTSSGTPTGSTSRSVWADNMNVAGHRPIWCSASLPYSSSIAVDLFWNTAIEDSYPAGTTTGPLPGMAFYFKGSQATGSSNTSHTLALPLIRSS